MRARRFTADDLVGVAEIAEQLKVSTSVVHDWRRRHTDFPAPVKQLRMGLVWAWGDVETWARKTNRIRSGQARRQPADASGPGTEPG